MVDLMTAAAGFSSEEDGFIIVRFTAEDLTFSSSFSSSSSAWPSSSGDETDKIVSGPLMYQPVL